MTDVMRSSICEESETLGGDGAVYTARPTPTTPVVGI
jgi:hypothetical protein